MPDSEKEECGTAPALPRTGEEKAHQIEVDEHARSHFPLEAAVKEEAASSHGQARVLVFTKRGSCGGVRAEQVPGS